MIRFLLVLTALLAAPASASAADPSIEDGSAQTALDGARERFERRDLDAYGYKVNRVCFCPREYTRTYRVAVRGGEPVDPNRFVRDIDTVPELLDIVQQAIDGDAHSLDVRYGRGGVPKEISIDRDRFAVDEELGIRVREFRRLR